MLMDFKQDFPVIQPIEEGPTIPSSSDTQKENSMNFD